MVNWTRCLSISAISGAVAMSVSASAQTAEPPLLTFFKTFCADPRGDEVSIKKAVEAAGSQVTILPDTDLTTMKLRWERGSGTDKITLSADTIHFRGKRIERIIPGCMVLDYSHDIAGGEAVQKWIGVPPSSTRPGRFQMYTYTYQETGGMKSAVPLDRFFDTDDVWRIDVDFGLGAISVFMSHNTIQPAPTSN